MDLRVSRSLELLGNLQRTVAAYARREAELVRDLRSRRFTVERKVNEAIERAEAKHAADVAEAAERFSSGEQRIKAVAKSRRERSERTQKYRKQHLPQRVRQAQASWTGELQMKRFRLERRMGDAIKDADTWYQDIVNHLGGDPKEGALAELQRGAKSAMGGYGAFQRMIKRRMAAGSKLKGSAGPEALDPQRFQEARDYLHTAETGIAEFRELAIPRFFAKVSPILLVAGAIALFIILYFALGKNDDALKTAGEVSGGLVLLIWMFHMVGHIQGSKLAKQISGAMGAVQKMRTAALSIAGPQRDLIHQQAKEEFERDKVAYEGQDDLAEMVGKDFEKVARARIETQYPRVMARIDEVVKSRLERLAVARSAREQELAGTSGVKIQQLKEGRATELAALDADEQKRWADMEADWKNEITPIFRDIEAMNAATNLPAWSNSLVNSWTPPLEFNPAVRFGHLEVDLAAQGQLPQDPRLSLPGAPQLSIPLALSFPLQGSLLFETNGSGETDVMGTFNNIILRLLATTPPGKISFTIIDPLGLGENFAGLMHLSDYEESLINRRIWTQRDQIEERLAELGEHIEKVIQMYLRNEYATITEYNEKAGSVAEKYHFLVLADFPAGFSETAARRLQSIVGSGARCGVFTLIHWDQRQQLPDGFSADELRQGSIRSKRDKEEMVLTAQEPVQGADMVFDPPPNLDIEVALVHKIGKASIDSNRVQVPFEQIAPQPAEFWTNDTTNELKIAVGRTGATKQQFLAIGKGTRQHALFAGKTGSGKSTLFHVIITNLALSCSPDQVEFYLIDFKKGVEFKCYAEKRLPHARVVAIESDREFGLSVLQRVDEELKRRGDLFRKMGVQDIPGYKRAGGTEPMPRSLLIIDEFQEFFVDDDSIAQTASLLFDRIVRQGRAFGIHVLLGSQTLGGSYSLARATLGQMVIRVALQCNEADAYLIMDENNSAPRLLSRPGEGIYNDAAGAIEGNSPFQVVWLPDDERDVWLDKVHDLAAQRHDQHTGPIVFEGNAPADVRENLRLRKVLETPATKIPVTARAWLGAPNSIKGPTEASFLRQSGNHLLIVGQREEAAVSMIGLSMLALSAQYPVGGVKFVLLQSAAPGTADSDFLDRIVAAIPHEVTVARGQEINAVMNDLAAEMKSRGGSESSLSERPSVFLVVHGLHKFKKLRQEDDFSFSTGDESGGTPAAQFNEIITEGSALGLHIITTVDTFNNVNRSISRKALSEFEMRVVFQMSANDSASLIDSPKASNLGLHRALFYNEHEGALETFRPYAQPDEPWIKQAAASLAHLTPSSEAQLA